MPRVVTAGVPMRMPLATIGGFLSNGMAFLLTVMPARPSACSAALPVRPRENTSTSIRWLSVPPLTSRKPASDSRAASRAAFCTICCWYVAELGRQRFLEAHGFGRDDVHQRPALHAGEEGAIEILRELRVLQSTMPPRGPRSVLCVVVVTKSEYGTGLGCSPAATSPAMCAMSVMTSAPASSAVRADAREIDLPRVRARADDDQLRPVLARQPIQLVVVESLVALCARRTARC